ncbi:zinc finger protein 79 isoform X2 [Antennarius striatus]|uniref:zinc finger protein 79 isoform X2 n=1 Tax=Antennarius striatus TaxID=241820 RepID=UPI0035B1A50A
MDKDKSSENSQCSWMEMHQLIGDLITSGNTGKDQPDMLTAAWGVAAANEVLGFKGASLELLEQPISTQDKPEASQEIQPGTSHRKAESRDRRDDVHFSCTCPGCPYSTSPSTFEILKPQQPLSSMPRSNSPYHRQLTSDAEPSSSTNNTSGQEARMSHQPQREETGRRARNPDQNSRHSRMSTSSLSQLSMISCLCCHRSLQTCAQILNPQEGTVSPFSHTHAHHHFHHHHCPLTSCIPCPQLVRSHAPQLAGAFSCLCCQHSFPTCAQERHHQYRQTNAQQQEQRERASVNTLHHCMHCPATFSRPSQLLQHQQSVHAHKPAGFICTDCGRTFNSHSNLRIHLNVHTGARPYSCSDCGKSFSQSGALKIHRRIHTGERPYSCGFCGKGFPHLAGVRAHQRTHTGERPYRCIQCGKCFTQSGALKIHIRIHTGERPFICSVCGKGFSNRSGIRFHYRTVHGLAPEHVEGAGGAAQGPAENSHQPGRPRSFHSVKVGLDNSKSPDSHTALHPRGSPVSTGHPGPALAGRNENKCQSDSGNPGSNREVLPYACEDCGLCFKNAPTRNRHQTLMHYSSGGREVVEEEEEGQREDLTTSESVCDNSVD